MKRNIVLSFLFTMVFIYGVAVGAKKIFPYHQIKYIKKSIFGNPMVGSCHKATISDILLDNNESQLINY